MSDVITINLTLGKAECIRGESVPFRVTLQNRGKTVIEEFPSFDRHAEALFLVAEPEGARPVNPDLPDPFSPDAIVGTEMSSLERDGRHEHGPHAAPTETLAPGATLAKAGDVLEWLGELKPGRYKVTAQHRGIDEMIISEPAMLAVKPASPVAHASAVPAHDAYDVPAMAAWTHQEGGQLLVFHQVQSGALPRNPRRCWRIGPASTVDDLAPATVASTFQNFGHLLWVEGGKPRVAALDLTDKSPPPPPRVLTPTLRLPGPILRSPRSMPDGSVMLVSCDPGGRQAMLAQIRSDGSVASQSFDFGRAGPVGSSSLCWEMTETLRLFACAAGGREVTATMFFLDDVNAPPVVRTAFASKEPVAWLHGYLDVDAAMKEQPAFEHNAPPPEERPVEPPPPKEMLWVIGRREGVLSCTRVNVTDNRSRAEALLDVSKLNGPRVVQSVLDNDRQVTLLLLDAANTYHVGSSATRDVTPLAEVAGESITPAQQPLLMASGPEGVLPFVYVRFLKPKDGRIAYRLLSPAGERDPAEHAHAHQH